MFNLIYNIMSDQSNLIFNRTLNLPQFKSETNVTKIHIKENPKTGKRFFATDISSITGKISNKLDTKSELAISECADDNGEYFWMLHNPTNVNTVETIEL